jgi:hypothetical protein
MGQDDEKVMPMLCCKASKTRSYACSTVDKKGPKNYAVSFSVGWLRQLGHKRILWRGGNEPALLALRNAVSKALPEIELVPRDSPPGDHAANGFAETGVRELKGIIRTMKSALEEKLGKRLEKDDPLLAWLPRHAASMPSRYRLGEDGKTAEQMRTGRKWRKPAVEYGELLLFRPIALGGGRKRDFSARMLEGIYVGHHERTGSVMVLTAEGATRGIGIARVPLERRWCAEGRAVFRGLPWKLKPAGRAAGGDVVADAEERMAPITVVAPAVAEQRRFYVLKTNIAKYGQTEGCAGCDAISGGGRTFAHNDECRERIRDLLAGDDERVMRHELRRAERADEAAEGGEAAEGEEVDAEAAAGQPSSSSGTAAGLPAPQERGGAAADVAMGGSSARPRQASEADTGERSQRRRVQIASTPRRSADEPLPARPGKYARQEVEVGLAPRGAVLAAQPTHMDDDVVLPPEALAAPGGDQISSRAAADEESMMTSFSRLKEAMRPTAEKWVEGKYRREGVAITSLEVARVADAVLQLGAADVAGGADAAEFGLRPGLLTDLTAPKPGGGDWDLSRDKDVQELEELQEKEKPCLLTGSPPSVPFSILLRIHLNRRQEADVDFAPEGRKHLRSSVAAYWRQIRGGRYFLHEHPKAAPSWKEPEMVELMEDTSVVYVEGPMCRWDVMGKVASGAGYVRQATGWITNCPEIADALRGVSSSFVSKQPWPRQLCLVNGRAVAARMFPPLLVGVVLRKLAKQLAQGDSLSTMEILTAGPVPEERVIGDGPWWRYWDDVNGGYLKPDKVLAARAVELGWVHAREVYEKVPLAQCFERTGKGPLSLRFVDTNKGDDTCENYRSRLVVREIKARKKLSDRLDAAQVFSAMPPLEMLRALCSVMATLGVESDYIIDVYDITRAHFYGKAERDMYTELPEGDQVEGMCAHLLRSMYGTEDASNIWQKDWTAHLAEKGYKCGVAQPACFYHAQKDVRGLAHGDDFVIVASRSEAEAFGKMLGERYDLKRTGRIGFGPGDDRELTVLNRILRTVPEERRVEMEADPRHAELAIKDLGLTSAKSVATPRIKRKAEEVLADEETPLLISSHATQYRSACMRMAYLAQDRSDLSEAVKSSARNMKEPRVGHMTQLKRIARYLIGRPRCVQEFAHQKLQTRLRAIVDSDAAGDAVTRRSTTGVTLMVGQHLLRHGSNLQSVIGLSSAESEYYAMTKGAALGLGLQAVFEEWGLAMKFELHSDSSAARAFASRRGLGKMRHVQTRYLWLQERVARGDITVVRVHTDANVADILTKAVTQVLLDRHLRTLGYRFATGRSKVAKQLLGGTDAVTHVQAWAT